MLSVPGGGALLCTRLRPCMDPWWTFTVSALIPTANPAPFRRQHGHSAVPLATVWTWNISRDLGSTRFTLIQNPVAPRWHTGRTVTWAETQDSDVDVDEIGGIALRLLPGAWQSPPPESRGEAVLTARASCSELRPKVLVTLCLSTSKAASEDASSCRACWTSEGSAPVPGGDTSNVGLGFLRRWRLRYSYLSGVPAIRTR